MRAAVKKLFKKSKKNWLKGLTASFVLLIGMMTLSSPHVSAATPTIKFSGEEASVTFENVNDTDLFQGFKGVMPGDTREQDLLLKSKPAEREASFYLKAECDDETRELLKDVTLKIEAEGQTVLESGLVFDQIKLGTVEGKGEMPIKLTAQFPLSLGNEIAEREMHIKWHITVQEDGKEIASGILSSENPGTGRFMVSMMPGMMLVVLVALVMAGVYRYYKRKKYPSAK